jgi:hypothetical protein
LKLLFLLTVDDFLEKPENRGRTSEMAGRGEIMVSILSGCWCVVMAPV